MERGIQSTLKKIGDEGCYFLCLLKACNVMEHKILDAYYKCLRHDYIGDDCFIKDGISILRMFGMNVSKMDKVDAESINLERDYKVKIACYVNGRYTHFVLYKDGEIWDSLGDSNTVRNGVLKSWRLYY